MSQFAKRDWTIWNPVGHFVLALMIVVTMDGATGVSAQLPEPCSPDTFYHARISWRDLERYLAAPAASPEMASSLDALVQQVYRPDGTMSYTALDALMAPEFKRTISFACSSQSSPPPGTPEPKAPQAYLDQVRQVDDRTAVAFIVLPDRGMRPAPGTPPVVVDEASGTPSPDTGNGDTAASSSSWSRVERGRSPISPSKS